MSPGNPERSDRPTGRSILVGAGAILVILVAGFSMLRKPRAPDIDLAPFQGIGLVAAEETARILAQGGKVLVVTIGAEGAGTSPFHAQLEAFQQAIQQLGTVSVAAVEQADQAGGRSPGPEIGIPGSQYLQLLVAYPEIDAIVSLVGPPQITGEELGRLPPDRPPLVVVSMLGLGVRRLLEAGVIQVAVVPRTDSEKAVGPDPQSPREWFERYYQIVTPGEADLLPN